MGPTDPLLKLRENSHSRRGPRRQVIADSLDLDWRSLNAAITQFSPLSELTRGVDHPLSLELTYLLSYPIKLTRQIEDGLQNVGIVGTRMLCLTPGFTTYWHHLDYPEVLSVFLDGSVYRSAVEDIFDCDPSDAPLIPQFAIVDPLLEQLAIAIIGSLRARTCEPLYIDTVARTMAAHFAQKYSSRSSPTRTRSRPVIGGRKLERVIDYIEANLGRDLRLETMAAQAEISSIYFAQSFKAALGQPPHRYVVSRRIERAKELLRNTDMPLEQVALEVGFCSQSHLHRLFMRHIGIPPSVYRHPS